MLTGESVPVSKTPATDDTLDLLNLGSSTIHADVARHMLFSGTKIIRARRPQDDKSDEAAALALVVRTGFNTTKGALVRSMLFPKPSGFKFYRDSFRYISVMAGIAAIGFIASLANFIRLGLEPHLIIVRALDLITIVVPPALPATLTIGTNFALSRLKGKQIFCISPQRVNVGGKIDVMCFDKTGTLTEDGLDVLGVRVVSRPANRFGELLNESSTLLPGATYERDPTMDYNANKAILYTMATCHSLRIVDDEFIGDPLDLKMFEFTGWQYEEGSERAGAGEEEDELSLSPSVARPPPGMEFDIDEDQDSPNSRRAIELGVLKTFEFVSHLRRASVVVRQFGEKSGDVYVKGAPEAMKDICRPESFPADYDDLLAYYTHRGFRVIACATKHIFKLNWLKVQKMKREDAESNLDFAGFIIFENKLKETTTEVIEELTDANIRTVMCTGDNILTAISVARECGLIDRSAHCFVPHFVEGDAHTALSKLSWESVDNPIYQLDENTLKPLPPPAEHDSSLPYDVSNLRNYSVAVSGDVFRWIIDFASPKVLREMLVVGQVFARMSPDEKHELVEKLQSIDYCAGFCGDGANDCGALKAADVGISLSEAEASVAAPFTSRVFDISCVPEVIREGRAALVTSFSCFKYMSLYSAIQFTSVSFLYATASNLGDFQFLFIDLALILPIAIFMGWSGPYHELSRKRPTASLVSRKVLTPLIGQIVICVMTQFIGWWFVRQQPWYKPPIIDKDHSNSKNSENSTLFLVSCFQYILSAIVLSVGKPFRQSMGHNLPFVITMLVALAISAYMLFDPAPWLEDLMELTYLSQSFKLFILALATGGFAVSYIAERQILPTLARVLGKTIQKFSRTPKKRKEYKIILEDMRAILGFAILKSASTILPRCLGGGYFGPLENVAVQSVATGAGSLSILFEGAVPALYRLQLLSPAPKEDFWRLITFTAVCAFYGYFFGIALRKFYIIRLKGIFPTPTATAITIRSLHAAGIAGGALQKAKVLVTILPLLAWSRREAYTPQASWDWNISWWIYKTTPWKSVIAAGNWGWYIQLTPAFFGVGMLTGLNVGLSYLSGAIVVWGVIGPATVHTGVTFGVPRKSNPDVISYKSLDLDDPVNEPSARYFLLWPGLMILMCATFTKLAMNAPALWKGLKLVIAENAKRLPKYRRFDWAKDRANDFLLREDHEDDDPAPLHERVPKWMWASGTFITIVVTCIVLGLQYNMNVGLSLLTHHTAGKASQLVFGGVTTPGSYSLHDKQLVNFVGGMVAIGAAAQSTDMVSDLRTGYLLGASHRAQFYGQLCGSFVAVWLSVGLFLLFTGAYPCILDASIEDCSFSTPAPGAWVAVAQAITIGYLAIAFGVLSTFVVYGRYRLFPKTWLTYVPNLSVFGLAFVVPTTQYALAMAAGAVAVYL
ncbi:hypothetical protein TI39_contig4286g00001 [Zymoseptoria brevis]|uniref:Cation-transporting ATPase n=1 Tax=Zymoseptoria brevis TaxID=1047168 RepID=A0A0F4G888_9PEZI|nr:hypothetical protein TI39_contig4286g00001 [Zymoseptoria brevis]